MPCLNQIPAAYRSAACTSAALVLLLGGASLGAVPIAHARPVSSPLTTRVAQAQTPGPAVTAQPALDVRDTNANELRADLDAVLRQYPPTLREVVRLDPSLLTDESYLASYPLLAAFLTRHPQVARNPAFYVGEPDSYEASDPGSRAAEMWRRTIETLSMVFTFLLVAVGLAWLVRTTLDHRRWLRTSRVQVELNQKLFDRLATNDDLITYLQTPAGQRVLDASPAVVDAGPSPRAVSAPINRILWSVQIGLVLFPFGLGLQWVATRVTEEVAQLMWFFGVLAVTIGIGFVVSAAVAYLISKHLGLIREVSDANAPGRPVNLD